MSKAKVAAKTAGKAAATAAAAGPSPSSSSSSSSALPRVIVFDLDGTLWNPEMYQLWGGGAPFTPHPTNPSSMLDQAGTEVRLVGESRAVLQTLATDPKWSSTYLAVSSTCDEPHWAAELLQKFKFTDRDGKQVTMGSLFGDRMEIYYANKADHHDTILQKARRLDPCITSYAQMLFFDNQTNNVRSVSQLGVPSCYCSGGMTPGTFARGLEIWRKAQHSQL